MAAYYVERMDPYYESDEDETDYESESEQYSSDSEEDLDSYVPEEPSHTKYNMVLCHHYVCNDRHSYVPMSMHLVYMRFKTTHYGRMYKLFKSMYSFAPKLKLELAECVYLPSGHCCAILKTFWIRIIQRKWKKVYRQRRQAILHWNKIRDREVFARGPMRFPGLVGMLSELRRGDV